MNYASRRRSGSKALVTLVSVTAFAMIAVFVSAYTGGRPYDPVSSATLSQVRGTSKSRLLLVKQGSCSAAAAVDYIVVDGDGGCNSSNVGSVCILCQDNGIGNVSKPVNDMTGNFDSTTQRTSCGQKSFGTCAPGGGGYFCDAVVIGQCLYDRESGGAEQTGPGGQ
jgi:hypothetical protein